MGVPRLVSADADSGKLPDVVLSDLAARTETQTRALFPVKTHVLVGSNGDFATLSAAIAAYPTGGVDIELMAGTHQVPDKISVSNAKFVTIRGQGRGTTLAVAGAFLEATTNSDQWVIRDLTIQNTTATNTSHGIVVDYPRRWFIYRCYFAGFGGDSIWFQGGLNCEISANYFLARDSTGTNGRSAIHIDKTTGGVSATTMRTRGNYVGSGKQYGLWVVSSKQSIYENDAAEYCDNGFRFEACSGQLIQPYTEANRLEQILFIDSPMTVSGELRNEPVVTWVGAASADRRITRGARDRIGVGKGIFAGTSTAITDLDLAPSLRWITGAPEGAVIGVVGSIAIRTDGAAGSTFYVKESGTGNTGWVAK